MSSTEDSAPTTGSRRLSRGGFSRPHAPEPGAPEVPRAPSPVTGFRAPRPLVGLPPPRSVPLSCSCRIVSCISQIEFYIFPFFHQSILQQIEFAMRSHGPALPRSSLEEGHVYLAYNSPYDKLSRAWLAMLGDTESHVFFVDFGTSAFVSNDAFYELPGLARRLAGPLAYCCGLEDADSRDLDVTQVREFRVFCESHREFQIEFTGRSNVHNGRVKHMVAIESPVFVSKKPRKIVKDDFPAEWAEMAARHAASAAAS